MIHVSDDVRDGWLEATRDRIDRGPGRAKMVLVAGTRNKWRTLSEHQLSEPCGAVSDCKLTFAPIAPSISAESGGAPTWAKIFNGAGVWVMDLQVGAEVKVDQAIIEKGQTVNIATAVLRARKQ